MLQIKALDDGPLAQAKNALFRIKARETGIGAISITVFGTSALSYVCRYAERVIMLNTPLSRLKARETGIASSP